MKGQKAILNLGWGILVETSFASLAKKPRIAALVFITFYAVMFFMVCVQCVRRESLGKKTCPDHRDVVNQGVFEVVKVTTFLSWA